MRVIIWDSDNGSTEKIVASVSAPIDGCTETPWWLEVVDLMFSSKLALISSEYVGLSSSKQRNSDLNFVRKSGIALYLDEIAEEEIGLERGGSALNLHQRTIFGNLLETNRLGSIMQAYIDWNETYEWKFSIIE